MRKAVTITSPKGFRAAAVKAGIKASGNLDLGLIVADEPCTAAGVFTTNKVVGAPVVVSRAHLSDGRAQAIYVNAGNANVCTGSRGGKDVATICAHLAKQVGVAVDDILVCSTGVIGHYLPMAKVKAGITAAAGELSYDAAMGEDVARAIMTTDTKAKSAGVSLTLGGEEVTIAGVAKGSGMIAPNMATMLAFLTTDAAVSSKLLQRALREATKVTFNKVTVDNHMSTSDTVLLLASGMAGNRRVTKADGDYEVFARGVWQVCDSLARQMAADGEGARRAIDITVEGAASAKDAKLALRAIADSPLVRCAFTGADPNWGRIISAVGYSGAACDPAVMTCAIADTVVFAKGEPTRFNAKQLSKKMQEEHVTVMVDLNMGEHRDFCYTCDLTHDYVTINADYHT